MTFFQNPSFQPLKDQNNHSYSIEARHSYQPNRDQEYFTQKQFAQTAKQQFFKANEINNEKNDELQVQMINLDKILSETESQESESLLPFQNIIDINETTFDDKKRESNLKTSNDKDLSLNFKDDKLFFGGEASMGDSVLGLLESNPKKISIKESQYQQPLIQQNQKFLQKKAVSQQKAPQQQFQIQQAQNFKSNQGISLENKLPQKQGFKKQLQPFFSNQNQTQNTLSSTATSVKANKLNFHRPVNAFSTTNNFYNLKQIGNQQIIQKDFKQNFKAVENNFQFHQNKVNTGQSRSFQTQINQKVSDENLEIFCVDCEEYIKIQDVEAHAQTCFKILNSKKQFQNQFQPNADINSLIYEGNLKLDKVCSLIAQKLTLFKQFSGGNLLVKEVIDIGVQLQNLFQNMIQNNQNAELAREYFLNIEKLNQRLTLMSNKEAVMLQILIFRGLHLSKEKCSVLTSVSNQNQQSDYQSNEIQAQIELWKEQCNMLKNIAEKDKKNIQLQIPGQFQINQIMSNYSQSQSSRQRFFRKYVVSQITENSQYSQGFAKACQVLSQSNWSQKEGLRREFYAEVICFKLTLPENKIRKTVLISDLFQECVQKQIPKEQWKQFIAAKLQC